MAQFIKLADATKIQIDWNKSWGWATRPESLKHWKPVMAEVLGSSDATQCKIAAQDLGCILHYLKCHHLLVKLIDLKQPRAIKHHAKRNQLSVKGKIILNSA